MPNKPLKELRALARSRGMRGYSRLSRSELEKLLSRHGGQKTAVVKNPKKPRPKKSAKPAKSTVAKASSPPARVPAEKKPSASRPQAVATAPRETPKWKWAADMHASSEEEEKVESAKYVTRLPDGPAMRAEATGLNEDIDNLPPFIEPMLCLLPQKPGVVHGYWVVPPDTVPLAPALKLRFGRIARDTLEIIDEFALPRERGHWYFHADTDVGAVYLQIGYYEPDGRFVNAIRRGVARIPSLHASERTDRLWWVSEEQFRAMYRRAGGQSRGPRLGWAASIGSPGGAPSSDRLAGRAVHN